MMRSTLFGVALSGAVLAACGGGSSGEETTPAATTEPAVAETPAEEPAGPAHLKFAEITVFEGQNPIFKIHADGKTEVASRGATPTEIKWEEGPSVQTDGTIVYKAQKVARVEADGTVKNLRTNEVVPVTIGQNTITAKGPGGEMTLTIQDDGTIVIPGAPSPDKNLRVEGATDAETRRTAIAVLGVIFLTGREQAPPPTSGTPAPAPDPAAPAQPAQPVPPKKK